MENDAGRLKNQISSVTNSPREWKKMVDKGMSPEDKKGQLEWDGRKRSWEEVTTGISTKLRETIKNI